MLRNLFCMFVAAAWTTILFPLTCVAMLVTLNPLASLWICRHLWSPVLLWAGGARLVVEGREHADPARPTLYVSNHQSTIDIPVLFMAIPVNVRFVAKKQLGWVPFLGWYLRLAGFPLVDRANRSRAIASLEEAGRRIRAGSNIIVYAEGTRSEDGRILPFKKGSFALALKARVPICPIAIEGSGKLMPKNSWRITPGEIRVRIGAPIDTAHYAEGDREALMREVRSAIIQQHLALGGQGGDLEDVVAETGQEGIGRARPALADRQAPS
jgi:1-acyl-sn-glycerol-3-phosphate acyltransferase